MGRQQLEAARMLPIAAILASMVHVPLYRPAFEARLGAVLGSGIFHCSPASFSAARIISSDGSPPGYRRQAKPVSLILRELASISNPSTRIVGDPKNSNA